MRERDLVSGQEVSAGNVDDLALGAAVVGSGGGGDTRAAATAARVALTAHGPVRLTPAAELDPGAWVAAVAAVGATSVMVERLPSSEEFVAAVRGLERHAGVRIAAIQGIEAGGINALIPVLCACWLGVPLIDADGMGRAFPGIDQTVFTAAGLSASPLVLVDSAENALVIQASSNASAEHLARAALPALGGWAAAAGYLMRASDCLRHSIKGSFSRARRLGAAVRKARLASAPAARHLLGEAGGTLLFQGTVIEVRQRTSGIPGVATLEHRAGRQRTLRIELADELLLAVADGELAAAVPDIICALDSRRVRPVLADQISPGQELDVWRFAAPAEWSAPPHARLGGLAAYGLAPAEEV